MQRNIIQVVLIIVVVPLAMLGCWLGWLGADAKVSSAFFDVPTSLTGPTTAKALSAKTAISDTWVTTTVQRFYATVRDQVRFGAEAAGSLKALLLELEQVKVGDAYLMDTETNITHTGRDGRKYRWTTVSPGIYFLEVWAADDTKSLELRFTRNGSHYAGTAVACPTSLGWTEPLPPVKNPDWVAAEFDTNSDGLGTRRLAVSLQGFRYHGDLLPEFENAVIVLTKDTSGTVKLGSIVQGPGSRHFVWDGYEKDSSNQDYLNVDALAETRYYVAAGVANSSNQATVYLGIPLGVDDTVFTDNGVGALVAKVFTDRLNNDYDFDGSQDTLYDQGHEIIGLLNTINGGNPTLDTAGYTSTPAQVQAALVAAQANLGTPDNMVDYLLSLMSVTNPAYFLETSYQSYGPTVPAGWLDLAEADARGLVPGQGTVEGMSIVFESSAAPGF